MKKKIRRWADLTWPELEGLRDTTIALIPTGSVEQHGPHLPTGTDLYIPMGIMDLLPTQKGAGDFPDRLVMLPPVFHTYAKESDAWTGTINLNGNTLSLYIYDVLRRLFEQGILNAVIFNGHMESYSFILEGIEHAVHGREDAHVLSINWWDLISDDLIREVFADRWPGWVAEHAALTETSLMLYLYPELVRMDKMDEGIIPKARSYKIFPQPEKVRPASGMYACADAAEKQIGRRLAQEVLEKLVPILKEEFPETRG